MKLLMFQAADFRFSADHLDQLPPVDSECAEQLVVFAHAEPEDASRLGELLKKSAKNIKWLANKRGMRHICLHSFAHLAEEKADPEFAQRFLLALEERLSGNGYQVSHTPFGASCAWALSVHQEPLAKVFKSL